MGQKKIGEMKSPVIQRINKRQITFIKTFCLYCTKHYFDQGYHPNAWLIKDFLLNFFSCPLLCYQAKRQKKGGENPRKEGKYSKRRAQWLSLNKTKKKTIYFLACFLERKNPFNIFFYFLLTVYQGRVYMYILYLYSNHSAICRPLYMVGRPWAQGFKPWTGNSRLTKGKGH